MRQQARSLVVMVLALAISSARAFQSAAGAGSVPRAARVAQLAVAALQPRPLNPGPGRPPNPTVGITASVFDEEKDPGEVDGLRVLKYPHPALRAENEEIVEFNDELHKLSRRMFKLMYAAKGVGLAAPQVGINKRLMVFNPDGDSVKWINEMVLVNPQIIDASDGKEYMKEGCLSFPGMNGVVARHKWIRVEYTSVKGRKMKKKFKGWEAKVFQHEFDHLNRVCYIDHLSDEDRAIVQPKLDQLIEDFGPGGAL